MNYDKSTEIQPNLMHRLHDMDLRFGPSEINTMIGRKTITVFFNQSHSLC